MSGEYEDVHITGVNRNGVREDPWAKPGFRGFPLTLSIAALPRGWGDRFNEGWQRYHSGMKCNARVEGNEIIVDCLPEELQLQIYELKTVIAKVNKSYREALARESKRHAHPDEEQAAEERRTDEILNNLDF